MGQAEGGEHHPHSLSAFQGGDDLLRKWEELGLSPCHKTTEPPEMAVRGGCPRLTASRDVCLVRDAVPPPASWTTQDVGSRYGILG